MILSLITAIALRQGLASDPRLAKAIGIVELVAPAPKVCADLGRKLGIPIECDPFLKEDLIVLNVRSRPAGEIMAKIASTFDWKWKRRGQGYRLEASREFIKKANTGREHLLLEEDHIRQAACRWALLAYKAPDVKAMGIALEREATKAPPSNIQFEKPYTAENPWSPVALAAFAELNDKDLLRLSKERIVLSNHPGPLELPLGKRALTMARRLLSQEQPSVEQTENGVTTFKIEGESNGLTRIRRGKVATILLEFDDCRGAYVTFLDEGGNKLFDTSLITVSFLRLDSLSLLSPKVKSAIQSLGREFGTYWSPYADKSAAFDYEELVGSEFKLANVLATDVISDAYSAYRRYQLLTNSDGWSKFCELAWKPTIENGWLVNRSTHWPRFRQEQAPFNLDVFEAATDPSRSIVDRAIFLGGLTDSQTVRAFARKQAAFYKFYLSLSASIRSKLENGAKIPLATLPASVIRFLYTLDEPKDENTWNYEEGMLTRTPFDEPEFGRSSSAVVSLRKSFPLRDVAYYPDSDDRDTDFAHLYSSRRASEMYVWVQAAMIPGAIASKEELTPLELSESSSEVNDAKDARHLRLAHFHSLRFHFGLGKGVAKTYNVYETLPAGPLSDNPEGWPKDLRKRISFWSDMYRKYEDELESRHKRQNGRPGG